MDSADAQRNPELEGLRLTALVALRILIGWHFLYEGLAKITNSEWTAAGYLQASQGWFSGFFQGIALSPDAMSWVNPVNAWGLMAIGLALMLGSFVRTAAVAGMLMLALYYLAAPPFPGLEYAIPAEGSYLIVNKVLIEMAALLVVFTLPTSRRVGLDRLIAMRRPAASPRTDFAVEDGR